MLNQRTLFIADTAFIDSFTIKQCNLLSVFPREEGDGAYRADLDSLLKRSKLQSGYYEVLLPKLVPIFKKYMPAAGSEVKYFLRPVLVTITSLVIDRCIRVIHRIRQQQDRNIAIVEVEPIGSIQWLSEINQTWRVNQEIIQSIMLALGFEKVHVFNRESYPEYPDDHKQRNLLFRPQRPGISGIIVKFLSCYYRLLRSIPSSKAKFQSLGFGADHYYLSKRGFFGLSGILQKSLDIKLDPAIKNAKLREDLLADVGEIIRPQFELLLSKLDSSISQSELLNLSKAYVNILINWFPVGFLEGLPQNFEKTTASLKMSDVIGVIGESLNSDVGYFECASARLAGKTVIGVQHGGHYGYIEDTYMGQFEYALFDKIITWGWKNIDPHLPQCETIALPSPRFSEKPLKANYLKPIIRSSAKSCDILFFSNLFHRFPHASTSGSVRVDFIDEITRSQEELVQAIKDIGLTVKHKPYNMKYVDLYPEHYRRLEIAGGSNYCLLKSTQKGLSVSLIKTCRIVLWDQIGSGTLECFTSGVPTIVYWKRIYSRESSWAKKLIADLECCGVVHTNAEELALEVKKYLDHPEEWMADKARKQAIQAFCEKFALTDSCWYSGWRDQLLKWSSGSGSKGALNEH